MSTVAIHHPQDPKRPTVIPADRFDASVHERWVEPGAPTKTPLPGGLPGRDALMAAGITTLEMLREVPDFCEVPGIGAKTDEALRTYLEGTDGA